MDVDISITIYYYMGMNKKVPILYFSGSGSTKMVAEVIAESLSGSEIEPVILEVSQKLTPQEVALYDFFVIATPTYNARPSQLLLDFIDKLPPAHHKKAAYIIATYGLYPINCQRIVGQHLLRRGIRPVGFSGVRGPASDGSLLFSSRLSFMFNYEKRAPQKIHAMVEDIKSLAHDWQSRPTKLPAVKWYTPFDFPVNTIFTRWYFRHFYRPHIRVLPDRWDGKPIDDSYPDAWQKGSDGVPVYHPDPSHDFALRAVHRTPNKAVIFHDRMKDKPRLTPEFYASHRQEILKRISQL